MPRNRFEGRQAQRSTVGEVLFPITCGRVEYLVRTIIYTLLFYAPAILLNYLDPFIDSTTAAGLVIVLILIHCVLLLLGCIIPRFRDIGWSPWLVVLTFIPGVNIFLSLVLLFVPGKPYE